MPPRRLPAAFRYWAIGLGAVVAIVAMLLFLAFGTQLPHKLYAEPALIEAVLDGDEALVEQLLTEGANPAMADGWSGTALMYAASRCNLVIVEKLVNAGASIDERSRMERTPLMWSARHGCEATVRYLIDLGADAKAVDSKGKTAADLAEENGYAEISTYLRKLEHPDAI